MLKKGLWILGAVAVALAAFGYMQWKDRGESNELRFSTTKVDRGSIVATITASGTVSALVTVQVGSQVSGRIREILVDFNSVVKKGQVIARIDPQLFQAALEQARANHIAAQGEWTKSKVQALEAERQFQRTKNLAERQLVSLAELDTAQATSEAAAAQVEASRGKVEQTKAALHQAKVNLDYTTIHSPINGVVISRSVDVGQTVAASLQAPTLFVIAEDLRKMQVDTSVAEADVGKLQPGMIATFAVDAYPSERFSGKVRQIRNAPQTLQNVVTYDAVIDVDNGNLKLKPGMTANVTFVFARKDDVLRVANTALRFRPGPELSKRLGRAAVRDFRNVSGPRDRRTVWVKRGNRVEPVMIRVGVTDGRRTELVEGSLRAGDLLVTDVTGPDGRSLEGGAPPSMRRVF